MIVIEIHNKCDALESTQNHPPQSWSVEKLSSTKPVPGAKRVGEHWFKCSELPLSPLLPGVGFHDFNPVSAKVTFPSQHHDFALSSPPLSCVVKDGFFFFPFLLLESLLFSPPTSIHLLRAFSYSPSPSGPLCPPFPSFPSLPSPRHSIPVRSPEPPGHSGKGKLTSESQDFF